MRLAGTCNRYSKKAMPQLTRITTSSGMLLWRRWPYQAKVMNTLESNNKPTVATGVGTVMEMLPQISPICRPRHFRATCARYSKADMTSRWKWTATLICFISQKKIDCLGKRDIPRCGQAYQCRLQCSANGEGCAWIILRGRRECCNKHKILYYGRTKKRLLQIIRL